jgi:hypothetical protein
MKKVLFLSLFVITSLFSNAQFNSRKDVIKYLCSRPFYDAEKEYKVEFKTKEVEFAGSISKQLQVFSNGNLLEIVNQSEVKLNPYDGREGQLHYFKGSVSVYMDVYFNGQATTNRQVRGKILCQNFFGLPVDVLIPGAVYK